MYTRMGIAVLAILVLGNQPARPQASNSFNGFALVDRPATFGSRRIFATFTRLPARTSCSIPEAEIRCT